MLGGARSNSTGSAPAAARPPPMPTARSFGFSSRNRSAAPWLSATAATSASVCSPPPRRPRDDASDARYRAAECYAFLGRNRCRLRPTRIRPASLRTPYGSAALRGRRQWSVNTLVTFLGKGRDNTQTGYRKTIYRFPDGQQTPSTAFFGLALADYLASDSTVILGTSASQWDVLVEHLVVSGDDERARLHLMEAVAEETVDQQLLDRLAPLLQLSVARPVIPRLIPFGRDTDQQLRHPERNCTCRAKRKRQYRPNPRLPSSGNDRISFGVHAGACAMRRGA